MDAQKRVLIFSVVGIVIVIGVMIVAGRYIFVQKVKPAVERVTNEAIGGTSASGSGSEISKSFPVEGLRALVVEGGWQVSLTHGEKASVMVNAPSDVMKDVSVDSQGGTVTISLTHEVRLLQGKLTATVVTPVVNKVDLRGGVKATIEGFIEPSLVLSISGAGSVTGSGNRVENLAVNTAGAADVNFKASTVTNAVVEVAGASQIVLTMNGGNLSGHLHGVGKVDYYGTVSSQNIEVSGLGSVKAKGE